MNSQPPIVIEVIGEGKTDVCETTNHGSQGGPSPQPPDRGMIPILVHTLCGRPPTMRVKCRRLAFLQKKGSLSQKVRFGRSQARITGSHAVVFVVDSDGNWKSKYSELVKGRDMDLVPQFPTALGVAHPCIEAWLLADAGAIQRAMALPGAPTLPPKPENLPAPSQNCAASPKSVLAQAASKPGQLKAQEKWDIAREMDNMELVCQRCPQSFAPFAKEVRQNIQPLFA